MTTPGRESSASPTTTAGLPLVAIGDLSLHDVDAAQADEIIKYWLASPSSCRLVCTPNVDYVFRARSDVQFRAAVQSCDLRVPDGMWVVYASRIAGRPLRATVTGRLLLPRLAAHCRDVGLPIAMVGAGPGVAQRAADVLRRRCPGLKVVFCGTPAMGFTVGSDADAAMVRELANTGPALIFVALGAPKQETWMERHRAELGTAVVIGVGQAFDVVAGTVREAPEWMTRVGLEWMFRLAQQPRRLARRYLVDDPWILWWALRTRLDRVERRGGAR